MAKKRKAGIRRLRKAINNLARIALYSDNASSLAEFQHQEADALLLREAIIELEKYRKKDAVYLRVSGASWLDHSL